MRETLTWQKVNRTHKKQCATPERKKNSTEHIQNIVRGSNVTNNPIEHIQNTAQNMNVTKHQTEYIQNRAQRTNVTNSRQNTYKTVRKTIA